MNKNIITFFVSTTICAVTAWLIYWGLVGLPVVKIIILSIPICFAAIMVDFFINTFISMLIDEIMKGQK